MEKIQVFDFERIFFGNEPASFLLEIVFRALIIYSYTVLLLRFLGKRSMGQLSTLELALIIGFGSAVGDPMLMSSVPIIHGIVVISTVALLQLCIEYFVNKNKKFEILFDGKADCIVDNGRIIFEQLRQNNLSHEDLFRFLRDKEVESLGEVKKAYFETSGTVSVIFYDKENIRPGLSILPKEINCGNENDKQSTSFFKGWQSCSKCGKTEKVDANFSSKPCLDCRSDSWESSI